MEKLMQLPKHILALVVISVGILFIVLSDPPPTVCGEEFNSFKTQQQGFLYKKPEESFRENTRFNELYNLCLQSNTMGGCYEFFQKTRKTLRAMKSFSMECLPKSGSDAAVKQFFDKSLDLLIQLAWGEKPPETVAVKQGWLGLTEIALFCELKDYYLVIYGDSSWAKFRENYLSGLPGSEGLDRNQSWNLSLVSLDCSQF